MTGSTKRILGDLMNDGLLTQAEQEAFAKRPRLPRAMEAIIPDSLPPELNVEWDEEGVRRIFES